MKTATFKVFGFLMTIFSVCQFIHPLKANATPLVTSAHNKSSFETITHGGGCCCATCMQPSEENSQDNPA